MKKVRYIYRKYLTQYDLDSDLFNKWDINVTDLYPFRKVYIIKDNDRKFILKNINYDKDRIDFVIKALQYIKKSFSNVIFIMKCKDGSLVAEYKNKYYILMELIEGRECSIENPIDIKISSMALAKFHNAGKGIRNVISEYNEYNNNISKMNIRTEELKNIKNMVSKFTYKDYFDKYIEENIDYIIESTEKCIERLNRIDMDGLRNQKGTIVLCHNDLAYHNILIKGDSPYFVDFEYSEINYRVKDIAQLIGKSIKNIDYDIETYKNIINSYESVSKLSDIEKSYLSVLLSYPSDIVELIVNYYYKRKDWSQDVFFALLDSKSIQEKSRQEFLKSIENIY